MSQLLNSNDGAIALLKGLAADVGTACDNIDCVYCFVEFRTELDGYDAAMDSVLSKLAMIGYGLCLAELVRRDDVEVMIENGRTYYRSKEPCKG